MNHVQATCSLTYYLPQIYASCILVHSKDRHALSSGYRPRDICLVGIWDETALHLLFSCELLLFLFSWQLIIPQAWCNIREAYTHKSVCFSSFSIVVVRHWARSTYCRQSIWWFTVSEGCDHHDGRQAALAPKQRLRHILRHSHESKRANQKWQLIGNGVGF